MKVAAWNWEFSSARGRSFPQLRRRLAEQGPDISILSEVCTNAIPDGQAILGASDWGYVSEEHHRKIALVSKTHWEDVIAPVESRPLKGRVISGSTSIEGADYRVVGVCIPWFGCHVSTGARDQNPWGEHKHFIAALGDFLSPILTGSAPFILGGDFNQTFPRTKADIDAYEALLRLLSNLGLTLATADLSLEGRLLNHIAVRGVGQGTATRLNNMSGGKQLTDHIGVVMELSDA